jgi:hypothetical protein
MLRFMKLTRQKNLSKIYVCTSLSPCSLYYENFEQCLQLSPCGISLTPCQLSTNNNSVLGNELAVDVVQLVLDIHCTPSTVDRILLCL